MVVLKIIVVHSYYGCDTGCCGHVVRFDDQRLDFSFSHPQKGESHSDFVKRIVTAHCGAEHVADIDFEKCVVIDD